MIKIIKNKKKIKILYERLKLKMFAIRKCLPLVNIFF